MAKIHAQVIGGSIQELDVETVGDVKNILNKQSYTATVSGDPQDDDYELSEYDFVALAPAVKGA